MSTFTNFNTSLKLEYLKDYSIIKGKSYWRVIDGFTYYSDTLKNHGKLWIEVPDSFYTDGASIPRIFWSWIPPLGQYGQAAVLHDYLRKYKRAYLDKKIGINSKCVYLDLKEIDKIFLEAMKVLGVSKFKRYTMYYAVRIFTILKEWLN